MVNWLFFGVFFAIRQHRTQPGDQWRQQVGALPHRGLAARGKRSPLCLFVSALSCCCWVFCSFFGVFPTGAQISSGFQSDPSLLPDYQRQCDQAAQCSAGHQQQGRPRQGSAADLPSGEAQLFFKQTPCHLLHSDHSCVGCFRRSTTSCLFGSWGKSTASSTNVWRKASNRSSCPSAFWISLALRTSAQTGASFLFLLPHTSRPQLCERTLALCPPRVQLWATVHQLCQRDAAAVLRQPHLQAGAGGVPERGCAVEEHEVQWQPGHPGAPGWETLHPAASHRWGKPFSQGWCRVAALWQMQCTSSFLGQSYIFFFVCFVSFCLTGDRFHPTAENE